MTSVLRPRGLPRSRSEGGAAAVEAALITPFLVLLVFGIIEFGFVFKDWLGVTSASRSGARIASAEPRFAGFATDAAAQVAREGSAVNFDADTVLLVYKAGTNGFPVGRSDFAVCPTTSCVKFRWSTSTSPASFAVVPGSTWLSTSHNACQGDSGHDSVGVYLAVKNGSVSGLFFDSLMLKSRTVMSLEPLPTTSLDTDGCKP
jgi:hypothetical protein